MKHLNEILTGKLVEKVTGSQDLTINGITSDSRLVKQGFIFCAVKGTLTDGHNYIAQAIEKGASVVVCENMPDDLKEGITYVKVKSAAKALGFFATAYFGNPSRQLKLIGVTGTNGKTTTATLLYRLFRSFGFKTGMISTICNYIDDQEIGSTHTTPDPVQLNSLLKDMVDTGCEYCFMEVSSHAIDQGRIDGLEFVGGIFTNITHDHLDYHKTFDAYIKAKKAFFDRMDERAFSLVNIDDRNGRIMVQNTRSKIYSYSLRSASDFKCRIIEKHFEGMLLTIDGLDVWTKFIGEFNAYNLLAVYACALLLKQEKEAVLKAISNFDAVRGRFEYILSNDGIISIVDYAHTPDALLNVLNAINQICKGDGQLITVVGAGGNRDKTKRPEMARVAAEKSNKVILTSDNPRFEDPNEIINDMLKGIDEIAKKNVIAIVDRKKAIKTACLMAGKGDIILVAGKGHETYQEVQGVKYDFDDKKVLYEIFNS